MTNVTTFSHTDAASSLKGSDSLNIRVTWDCENSGGITTFNVLKIEIKDDGMQYSGRTGFVELGITVNGVRVIDVSTFQGTARITSSPDNWSTVIWQENPLTGSATFVTPIGDAIKMELSSSTSEQFVYPSVYYSEDIYYHLMTSLSQTIEDAIDVDNVNTVICTINGQHSDNDKVIHTYDKERCYAGTNPAIDNWKNYVYCLKFTTPTFAGKSNKISIILSISKIGATNTNLRYALCTSDANYANYYYTDDAVTDSYQIVSGDKTLYNLTSAYKTYTFDITTTALQPNTTYYFYLWGYNNVISEGGLVYLNTIDNHVVTVAYDGGVIYIDNGSSFDVYAIYIDNGSSWDLYQAYIDNGTSWDICG